MAACLKIVMTWKAKFSRCDFKQIPKSENRHTDSLATIASVVDFQFRPEIPVEHIPKPSIHKPDEKLLRLDSSWGWRDTIISFLKDGTLPEDKTETQKLQHLATRYILLGESYTRSHTPGCITTPYLRCLRPEEARSVIQEIRDSDCENHMGD